MTIYLKLGLVYTQTRFIWICHYKHSFMSYLLHHFIRDSSHQFGEKTAVFHKKEQVSYTMLWQLTKAVAYGFNGLGFSQDQRVAIYLPKQIETIAALFGSQLAGGIAVPINPLLKSQQVKHIIQNCEASILVTSEQRWQTCSDELSHIKSLKHIIICDDNKKGTFDKDSLNNIHLHQWQTFLQAPETPFLHRIDQDIAAILYTSGSTGLPKGVVLSHANMVAGAHSVTQYLNNSHNDRLLAVLPFSFDYGLSQLTTAFSKGASVVLLDYLFPKDVIQAIEQYQITGLAGVPSLWQQMAHLDWSETAKKQLRYWTNSGGKLAKATLQKLQQRLPNTQAFLMYGLTEAFRSTYLPPSDIHHRPDSIGKAIPNADVFVARQDGSLCEANEIGELVHRGVHVSLGYWNAPEKNKERFRPLKSSLPLSHQERVVWSGDQVYRDEEGFLYFVGREDAMIKSSGYRISPEEIESLVLNFSCIKQAVAIGQPDEALGESITLALVLISTEDWNESDFRHYCMDKLPNYMQPKQIILCDSLPMTPNGKIDRPAVTRACLSFIG